MNQKPLKVVGFDPSLRNWGVSVGSLFLSDQGNKLEISDVSVIQPVLSKGKQVRQSSLDLESATQLAEKAIAYAKDADLVFVEVPIGSQSARAMASYGICIGVLGALRAYGIPFIELNPTEVKVAATSNKNATKSEMIDWATKTHPEAPWPTFKRKGSALISETKAEHMADATAAIHAGLQSQQFQQMKNFLKRN